MRLAPACAYINAQVNVYLGILHTSLFTVTHAHIHAYMSKDTDTPLLILLHSIDTYMYAYDTATHVSTIVHKIRS